MPTDPVRFTKGEAAKAVTMAWISDAASAWLCVALAIQSNCTNTSGLLTVAPIFGRSMNCGPLPSPGSIVTPLFFQSSGIPSQVADEQSKLKVIVALFPLPSPSGAAVYPTTDELAS